ncbi:MAG: hypothetical protein N2Z81_01455 [Hydrogenothermaceae bacterium]|nr:hypothetical protein [Hydrogenothermaceae bacterium]
MEKVLEFVNKLSSDKDFILFTHRNEIWLSGYKDGKKVDIFIRFLKDGKIKFIYELPEERKVALFLNEDNLVSRLKTLTNYEVV